MSMAEWDRTPWYEQRILQEGLFAEQPWIQRAALLERVSDPLALASGVFYGEPGADPEPKGDGLASYGVRIRRSDVVTPIYRSAAGG